MSRPSVHLILASRSPRRRELLAEAGYMFTVCAAEEDVESDFGGGVDPGELVRELARRKAANVAERLRAGRVASLSHHGGTEDTEADRVVLGCDTVVECGGQILGKPADRRDARRILETLRGRRHRVLSGVCLWPLDGRDALVDVAATTLRMDPLGDPQLDDYLAGGEWEGKAGAFGYQDRTGWVHVVEGSESNVVGLPMELLAAMLGQFGYATPRKR